MNSPSKTLFLNGYYHLLVFTKNVIIMHSLNQINYVSKEFHTNITLVEKSIYSSTNLV